MVYSGYNNFVSCDEMEFFRYNKESSVNDQLLKVFTDLSCTALNEGVTEDVINELPGYFARLALALYNDTYDTHEKEFRIRKYAPYSDVVEWADKLMTKNMAILIILPVYRWRKMKKSSYWSEIHTDSNSLCK